MNPAPADTADPIYGRQNPSHPSQVVAMALVAVPAIAYGLFSLLISQSEKGAVHAGSRDF